MLVLSRKDGHEVLFRAKEPGEIIVRFDFSRDDRVKVQIAAGQSVEVVRAELVPLEDMQQIRDRIEQDKPRRIKQKERHHVAEPEHL